MNPYLQQILHNITTNLEKLIDKVDEIENEIVWINERLNDLQDMNEEDDDGQA